MSAFNFTDFVIYSNIKNTDGAAFATIARGVISVVKSMYGIQVENGETIVLTKYGTGTLTEYIEQSPIVSVTSVTYNGINLDYTLAGQTMTIVADIVTDTTIPIIITLSVGYSNVPDDLKFAIYRHIESVYFDIEHNTDNVVRSVNSSGNTVEYKSNLIPAFSKSIYDWYSKRQLVLY